MKVAHKEAHGEKSVGAVRNAFAILRFLASQSTSIGVNLIARETGVSVSTSFNILRTLANDRMVVFDPETKTYRLGLGLLDLTAPMLGTNQTELIYPELEKLSRKHSSLICLWHPTEDGRIVLINRVSSSRTVRVDMPLGARLPAHAGAIGRCYASFLNEPERTLKKKFQTVKWQAPPTFDEYFAAVKEAGETGYAFDFGQLFKGLEIAASIITDNTLKPRYGISGIAIAGQMNLAQINDLAHDLRDTSDLISETLFGSPSGQRQQARKTFARRQSPSSKLRMSM
jgi:DNA-binding IclR family transcriptional regulator